MRYGIFSDVHSNLEAFQPILSAYKDKNIDKYYCLGDIVGYAANPRECINLIQENNIEAIAGNHDWAIGGKIATGYFSENANAAILWAQKNISDAEKGFLNNLQLIKEEEDFILVHATPNSPQEFIYALDLRDVPEVFTLMARKLCFVGHTHRAGVFMEKNGELFSLSGSSIKIEIGNKYIVNVGSVGQPRDRDPRASFCIYDSEKKEVEFLRLDYDIENAQNKIINSGLPLSLAQRLSKGT